MGYDISMTVRIKIPVAKTAEFWKEFETFKREGSYLSESAFDDCSSIEDVFSLFGFECRQNKDHTTYIISEFERERDPDMDQITQFIAPMVEDGSYAEIIGEDGERWKYVFKGGKVKRLEGKTVYEEEEE